MAEATPSEAEVFRKDEGTWDAHIEVHVPGMPVQESRGTLVGRRVGPWLVTDFKNETTGFEGRGIYGWDATRKKYVGTWIDPMRSALVVMEGQWDAEKRTMTFAAEMTRADGGRIKWREVTETVDTDTQVYRSVVPLPDGGEHEMMRVKYTRRVRPEDD
jgi:hypothetical protein